MSVPLAFLWFARDHGLFCAGVLSGILATGAVACYPRSGWAALGAVLGVGLLLVVATLFRWWR